jgi:hypothetical protein
MSCTKAIGINEIRLISYTCITVQLSQLWELSIVLFYLKINSIDLYVPQKSHITSPLRAQQVNVFPEKYGQIYKVFVNKRQDNG